MFFRGDDAVAIKGFGGTEPRYAQPGQITLYFIQYQVVKEDGRMRVPLRVKGRSYMMPALGESFTVDEVVGRDIAERLRMYDPKTGWTEGVTTDEHIAKAVRAAFDAGNIKELKDFRNILSQGTLASLDTEELEKELERRKAAMQTLTAKTGKGKKEAVPEEVVEDKGENK